MPIPGVKELVDGAFRWADSHFSFRYFFTLFVLCLVFLLGINPLLAGLGLPAISSAYRALAAAGCLIFGAGTIVFALEAGIKKGQELWKKRATDKAIRDHLHALPADQIAVLLRYVQSDKSSQMFDPYIGAVCDLERRGILYRSSNVAHRTLGILPYTITPAALPYLRSKKFQEILSSQKTD